MTKKVPLYLHVDPTLRRRLAFGKTGKQLAQHVEAILQDYVDARSIWPQGEGPPDPPPRYGCEPCRDTGWVPDPVGVGTRRPSSVGSSICRHCLNRAGRPQPGCATEEQAQRGLNDTWPGDPYP